MSFLKTIYTKPTNTQRSLLEGLNDDMNAYGAQYDLNFDGFQSSPEEITDEDDQFDGEYVDVDELDAEQLAKEIEDLKHDLEMALDQNDDPQIINQIIDNLKCIKSVIVDRLEQDETNSSDHQPNDELNFDSENDLNLGAEEDLENDDSWQDFEGEDFEGEDFDLEDEDIYDDFDQYKEEDEECCDDQNHMSAFDNLFLRARMDEAKAVDVDKAKSHRQRVDSILRTKGASTHKDKTAYDRKQNSKTVKDQLQEGAKSKGNPELAKYVNAAGWPKDLEGAKQYGHEAITKWDFTEKAAKYHRLVDAADTVSKVQRIVINTLLSGEGLGVVK